MIGRGNKLYEGSRMILPEHREMLMRRHEEEQKQPKPELDPQRREEIGRVMQQALNEKQTVEILYFDDGHVYSITGTIQGWDMLTQRLRVMDEDGYIQYIPFADVLDVTG